jgi:lipopolysaccharide heptosyltransferase II
MKSSHLKILIIRLSSIGDILLTTPFIRATRHRFQTAQIDYIVKNQFQELLVNNPHINNLILFDSNDNTNEMKRIRELIRRTEYDYIFDLHNNLRSNYFQRGIKTNHKYRIQKNKFRQLMLVKFKKNLYKNILSIPERYLATGRSVEIKDDGRGLEIYWDDYFQKKTERKLAEFGLSNKDKYIAVSPGAGFYTKRYPIEYYRELLKRITGNRPLKIAITGSEAERELADKLADLPGAVNLAGKLSLLETAVCLSRAVSLLSNDSGLMHMASAVNTPVLAIFGSTVKELGFCPFRVKARVVENENLYCRPCSHIGRNECPEKHFRCMMDLTPELVFHEYEKLMQIELGQ